MRSLSSSVNLSLILIIISHPLYAETSFYQGRPYGPNATKPPMPSPQTPVPTTSVDKNHPQTHNFIIAECLVAGIAPAKTAIPCPQLPIILLDQDSKEISKTQVAQGSFWFSIKDDKPYYFALGTNDFTIVDSDLGPYHRGAKPTITVIPKNTKAE